MKNLLTLFVLGFVILPFSGRAQIELVDHKMEFDGAERNCFYYQSTCNSETKDLHRAWKRFMRKEHDVDLDTYERDSHEQYRLEAEETKIEAVSNLRMNLYTEIQDGQPGLMFIVLAAPGYDIYLGTDTYPEEYEKLKELTKAFLIDFYKSYCPQRISELEKTIKDLEKEIKDQKDDSEDKSKENADLSQALAENPENKDELKKQVKENLDKIEDNNEKIEELEKKIKEYREQIEKLQERLQAIKNQS